MEKTMPDNVINELKQILDLFVSGHGPLVGTCVTSSLL